MSAYATCDVLLTQWQQQKIPNILSIITNNNECHYADASPEFIWLNWSFDWDVFLELNPNIFKNCSVIFSIKTFVYRSRAYFFSLRIIIEGEISVKLLLPLLVLFIHVLQKKREMDFFSIKLQLFIRRSRCRWRPMKKSVILFLLHIPKSGIKDIKRMSICMQDEGDL